MNNRYEISGITQSYNHTSPTRTVIMPLLIIAILGAMGAFYFYGKPKPEELAKIPAAEAPSPETGDAPPTSPIPVAMSTSTTPKETSRTATPLVRTGEPPLPEVATGTFTPWMTPDGLDSWVRKRNEGHSVSFWQRGHWITAVEGRWNGDTHEFRIAFDSTPSSPDWRWQYRVNQTPEEFMENSNKLQAEGFRMVQVQSFDHPDKRRRYQAVWEKSDRIGSSVASENNNAVPEASQAIAVATVTNSGNTADTVAATPANTTASPTTPTTVQEPFDENIAEEPRDDTPVIESGILDVNNLQFR